MIQYLHIALWIVFFYDAIVLLLLPSSVQFMLGTDGSAARYVVDFMALGIAGWVGINYGFKKIDNIWMAIFLLIMVASHFHSPNINFQSTFLPKDMAIYNYKPMFEILVFMFMFLGITSLEFTSLMLKRIFQSICWIAVVYSVYILLQHAGLDQFYKVVGDQASLSRNPESGGFISQPVFAAAFLAMCIPFLIKNRSYWMIGITLLAILATGNRSACIATFICFLMSYRFWERVGKITLIGYLSFLLCTLVAYCINPLWRFVNADSGRLPVWKNLFVDFIHPHFPGINTHYILTGHGIGSFPVLFPFFHQSGFYQAHNELFELIYATGLLGAITAFLMVKNLIKQPFKGPISIGLIAITICAMTNAVWHIPQLAFLTVLLVGLSYNKTIGVNYVEAS